MKTVSAVVAALTLLALGCAPAWAVLGEYESSVASDQQAMRGELQVTARAGYMVQEIKGARGTVVKEYISPQGLVFGISWQGPALPNLQQLLGSYFADWQKASASHAPRRGPLVVRTDKFVIESGGHVRAFRGRAFAPPLFPKNLGPEVIQ